jgi:aminomethyltransferase
MLKFTPLLKNHQLAGAKLVDFSGWQMPLHYGSQIQEHHFVRQDVGLFDVSHMAIVDVSGPQAGDYLRFVMANDVAKLDEEGKALYTCMLNEQGGIIDDLIVYKLGQETYRLVLNAGTREQDWQWLQLQQKNFEVSLLPRHDLAMLALQGPNAITKILSILNPQQQQKLITLKPFQGVIINDFFYSRTGYTGEDGLEIQIPTDQVQAFWQKLLALGVAPCGLGARDTLRLEAGLNLYGVDMNETTTPLESNLAWTVAFEPVNRYFIGREALEQQRQSEHRQMIGLILTGPGVLRHHQQVFIPGDGVGEITSGTFSPTLGHSIALARIPASQTPATCEVAIRDKKVLAHVVKPPFVRKGKQVFKMD